MARTYVVVDGSERGADGKALSVTYECAGVGVAQAKAAALTDEWRREGWVQRHEVWVKGGQWRQKVLVVGGVEVVEADGVDE